MMLYLRNSIGTPAESGFVPQGLPSFSATAVKGLSLRSCEGKAIAGGSGYANGNDFPVISC